MTRHRVALSRIGLLFAVLFMVTGFTACSVLNPAPEPKTFYQAAATADKAISIGIATVSNALTNKVINKEQAQQAKDKLLQAQETLVTAQQLYKLKPQEGTDKLDSALDILGEANTILQMLTAPHEEETTP